MYHFWLRKAQHYIVGLLCIFYRKIVLEGFFYKYFNVSLTGGIIPQYIVELGFFDGKE